MGTETIKDDEAAFRERVGQRLRAARLSNSLSLQQVADHFGLVKQTVGHWETGTNPPDIGRLFRLARHYGTTVTALISDPLSHEEAMLELAKALIAKQAREQDHQIESSERDRDKRRKQSRTGT